MLVLLDKTQVLGTVVGTDTVLGVAIGAADVDTEAVLGKTLGNKLPEGVLLLGKC